MAVFLSQLLTGEQTKVYFANKTATGVNSSRISGFCLPYSDALGLKPAEIIELFEAEHPGIDGKPVSFREDDLYLLVFEASMAIRMDLVTAAIPQMDGTISPDRFLAPFRGMGLSGLGDHLSVQYLVDGSAPLPPGAQIRRVRPDGQHQVLGTYMPGPEGNLVWVPPDQQWSRPPTKNAGWHEFFIEISGMFYPAYELNGEQAGIMCPDSRAAWLMCPAYDFLIPMEKGVMACYAAEHIDRVCLLRTVATWRNKEVIIEGTGFEDQCAYVLYIGAPDDDLREWHFEGDQYHGFRACLPMSEVEDTLREIILTLDLGQRPRQAVPEGPYLEGEEATYHKHFLMVEDKNPIPVIPVATAEGTSAWGILVPDPRAAAVMAPEALESLPLPDGRRIVLTYEAFPDSFVGSAVTVAVSDEAPFVISGVSDGNYVGFRITTSGFVNALEHIDPTQVTRRDERILPEL